MIINLNNISCCIPKYDQCLIEEDDLNEKNIIRKNKDGQYATLYNKTIAELKDMYNEIEELAEITAEFARMIFSKWEEYGSQMDIKPKYEFSFLIKNSNIYTTPIYAKISVECPRN